MKTETKETNKTKTKTEDIRKEDMRYDFKHNNIQCSYEEAIDFILYVDNFLSSYVLTDNCFYDDAKVFIEQTGELHNKFFMLKEWLFNDTDAETKDQNKLFEIKMFFEMHARITNSLKKCLDELYSVPFLDFDYDGFDVKQYKKDVSDLNIPFITN